MKLSYSLKMWLSVLQSIVINSSSVQDTLGWSAHNFEMVILVLGNHKASVLAGPNCSPFPAVVRKASSWL